jgi:hypothetical protein
MAKAEDESTSEHLNNYAARHPRRMYSTMLMVGTALGASLMAAKKNHDKSMVQKFLDQLGR